MKNTRPQVLLDDDELTMVGINKVELGVSTARLGDLFPVCRRRPMWPLGRLRAAQRILGQLCTIRGLHGETQLVLAGVDNPGAGEQQDLLTQAAQQTDQLSKVLYKNGGASYLQVLTSETNYFSAELNLVQAQLNERLALVQLYQTLGGGWQQ